jgi:hypothetical protein
VISDGGQQAVFQIAGDKDPVFEVREVAVGGETLIDHERKTKSYRPIYGKRLFINGAPFLFSPL